MQRRSEQGPLNGFLEFPGGKVEAGEAPVDAACREITEETGARATHICPFKIYPYKYPDRSVILHTFLCTTQGLDPRGWHDLNEDFDERVLDANGQILRDLRELMDRISEFKLWDNLWKLSPR